MPRPRKDKYCAGCQCVILNPENIKKKGYACDTCRIQGLVFFCGKCGFQKTPPGVAPIYAQCQRCRPPTSSLVFTNAKEAIHTIELRELFISVLTEYYSHQPGFQAGLSARLQHSYDQLMKEIDQGESIGVVAVSPGSALNRYVGFLSAKLDPTTKTVVIMYAAVVSKCRGHGVFHLLCTQMLTELRTASFDYSQVFFVVDAGNEKVLGAGGGKYCFTQTAAPAALPEGAEANRYRSMLCTGPDLIKLKDTLSKVQLRPDQTIKGKKAGRPKKDETLRRLLLEAQKNGESVSSIDLAALLSPTNSGVKKVSPNPKRPKKHRDADGNYGGGGRGGDGGDDDEEDDEEEFDEDDNEEDQSLEDEEFGGSPSPTSTQSTASASTATMLSQMTPIMHSSSSSGSLSPIVPRKRERSNDAKEAARKKIMFHFGPKRASKVGDPYRTVTTTAPQLADVYNAGAELLRLSEFASRQGMIPSLPGAATPLGVPLPSLMTSPSARPLPGMEIPGAKLPNFANLAFSSSDATKLMPSRPLPSPSATPQFVQNPYLIPFPMVDGQQMFQPAYYFPMGFPYAPNMALGPPGAAAAAAAAASQSHPQFAQSPHGFPVQIQVVPQMQLPMPGLPFTGFPTPAPPVSTSSSSPLTTSAAVAALTAAAAATRPTPSQTQ